MQVLQITSVPMKYDLNIEHARLEYQQNFIPRADVTTTPATLKFETKNIQVQLDAYQARKSLGMENIADIIKGNAERGRQSISQKTREYVEMGQQMSEIQDGATISQIIRQKTTGSQPGLFTAFLPSGGVEISWLPNQIDTTYQKGQMTYDWENMRNVLNYVPGSVSIDILEYAHVDVEYTGGPIYFPRSANPNYVEIPTI